MLCLGQFFKYGTALNVGITLRHLSLLMEKGMHSHNSLSQSLLVVVAYVVTHGIIVKLDILIYGH